MLCCNEIQILEASGNTNRTSWPFRQGPGQVDRLRVLRSNHAETALLRHLSMVLLLVSSPLCYLHWYWCWWSYYHWHYVFAFSNYNTPDVCLYVCVID